MIQNKKILWLLWIFLIFASSCGKEYKISIYKPFIKISKLASMASADSYAPHGLISFGTFLKDEKGQILQKKDLGKIDRMRIFSPDGSEYQPLNFGTPFRVDRYEGASGYRIYGKAQKRLLVFGVDLLYDAKKPLPSGNYTFEVISNSGNKAVKVFKLKTFKKDPISGFPQEIRYNEKTRMLSWKATKGQSGYQIKIIQGVKEGSVDISKMVYITQQLGDKTSFKVPMEVVFKANTPYYFTVDAFYSEDKNPDHASYIHNQDKDVLAYTLKDSSNAQNLEALSPLDQKYPYQTKTIDIKGHKLVYIDQGKGDPILFIHGVSTNLKSFSTLYPDLVKNNFRVLAIDLFGYGKSDKLNIKYSLQFHADTINAFIEKLGLKKVILVGHSMGGALSLLSAIQSKKEIGKLILIAPAGLYGYPENIVDFVKKNYDSRFGIRYKNTYSAREYFKKSAFKWNESMENFMQNRERMMRHPIWAKIQKTIKDTSLSLMSSAKNISSGIEKIKIPVMVILAKNDPTILSDTALKAIKKHKKSWKVKVYENCGHMIPLEKDKKLISDILDFLK